MRWYDIKTKHIIFILFYLILLHIVSYHITSYYSIYSALKSFTPAS